MSKIFEALNKTEGDVADVVLTAMTEGLTEPVENNMEQTVSAARTAILQGLGEPPTTSSTPRAVPLGPAVAVSSTNGVEQVRAIRTISLHLSADTPVLPFDPEHGQAGEQYRIARTKLLQNPLRPRLIVISSAGSGDGKTVTAINLAGAMALKSEAEVLLVDADLRRSQIAALLGIPATPGLADVLSGTANLEDAVIRLEQFPNLCVLPGGDTPANPTELLDSSRWTELCTLVRRQYKYVVFDAPPMATVADYDLIQAQCDGVVLVVRPDHTSRKLCMEALQMVPKDRLLGAVMNCVRDSFLWKTRDYYS